MIGKIQRVPLRQVWKHEAYDFTKWLQENLDVLNELLGLGLSNAEREQNAGDFSVDLIAEDEAGKPVIIENQLGKSNHDHLGKLITYLTAINASTAIWIVSDPRPEHVNAITWLNETSSASFYFLKIEGIRIGDSPPAPLLTLIVGPSEEIREGGKAKEEIAERYTLRKKFWTGLLNAAKAKTKLHANISPAPFNWIGTSAGVRGLNYNYVVRKNESDAELYIDFGKDTEDENKKVFDKLFESKENIESVFGDTLEWQRLDTKRACRIKKTITVGGYRDDEKKWPEIYAPLVNSMINLDKALKPYINKLEMR